MNRIEVALREYQCFNRVRNDLEAYLFYMGEWALYGLKSKPNPQDFGVPAPDKPVKLNHTKRKKVKKHE